MSGWSASRLVLAVLDAHGGPMSPADVVAEVARRTKWHRLTADSAKFKGQGSAVQILDDGRWSIAEGASDARSRARSAVRERLAMVRRWPARMGPAALDALQAEWQCRRDAHAAELAGMSRALIAAFPPERPRAVALLDVGEHTLATFVDDQFDELRARLSAYQVIGGLDVRALLRALGFAPGERRLAELGPPQKTMRINQRGRTLAITTAMLVQGSCGIGQPLGDADKLAQYLARGETTKLVRRLEADVKSLYALYEYGRLHGMVRLRWGFLDELLPAPWVHEDETTLYDLMKEAYAKGVPLEVVVGSAPGWSEPWARVRTARVEAEVERYRYWLVDEDGRVIDDADVQRARVPGTGP